MIRPERLTIKAQEAFRDAGELARRRGNPVVNDAHLLAALLAQPEGVVQPLLQKVGLNVTALIAGGRARARPVPDARRAGRRSRRFSRELQPGVRPRRCRRQEAGRRLRLDRAPAAGAGGGEGHHAPRAPQRAEPLGGRPARRAARKCAARTASPISRPRRSSRRSSGIPGTSPSWRGRESSIRSSGATRRSAA